MAKNKIAKEILEWALTIIIPVVAALLIHQYLFTFARVDGTSMLDTLHENNIMGVSRLHYRLNEPQRGEIITCNYPGEGSKLFVKRIIGLPGETVTIVDGKVYIDGSEEPLSEPYLPEPMEGSFGPYVVPEGAYFMMGDNRNHSQDARYWTNTFVYEDQMVAKVIFSYFPTVKMIDGVYFD